jgi:hypothetical protein
MRIKKNYTLNCLSRNNVYLTQINLEFNTKKSIPRSKKGFPDQINFARSKIGFTEGD